MDNSIIKLEKGPSSDFSSLLNQIGDAKIVLLGESTHGTHEFYKARAEISKQLIQQKGFNAIAVEADWPSAYKINKFVKGFIHSTRDARSRLRQGFDGQAGCADSKESLSDFKRFPTWMWANKEILELINWMYKYNQKLNLEDRVGFYGLDLYSLHESAYEVIEYLKTINKVDAQIAKERYACFDKFGDDPQKYGYFATQQISPSCQKQSVDQAKDLIAKKIEYLKADGFIAKEEFLCAKQNAFLVKNAEEYYRLIFTSSSYSDTWNFRDTHMLKTLRSLYEHQKHLKKNAKIIVWAHNSHVGDARATEFKKFGQINLGQLARETFGKDSFIVGFTTYKGTVCAASDWGGVTEKKIVRPALPNSVEEYFHKLIPGNFVFNLKRDSKDLPQNILERAIGVIYLPQTERSSHYFYANVAEQFDAVIHFDETTAVEPLEKISVIEEDELQDTFPSGF